MADYKTLHGSNIEVVASDPSNPIDGQVWYNTTTNIMKGRVFVAAAWASGGNLGTARSDMGSSTAGTQTAALIFGGDNGSPPPGTRDLGNAETYNGSAWSEVGDLNTTRRYLAGSGTTTSALAFGGTIPPATAVCEKWAGSSWTEVGDLNTARGNLAGCGADNTSALAFSTDGTNGVTESWNGTSWTEVVDLNTHRSAPEAAGIITAALCFGGSNPADDSQYAVVELWNGTAWTEVGDLNTARVAPGGLGTSTAALAFGGYDPSPAYHAVVEKWNGTSWTEIADLSAGRFGSGGAGTTSAGLAAGGKSSTAAIVATEEFTGDASSTVTFDASDV